MNKSSVSNPKTQVSETPEMNDRDYLNDVLQSEKNMSNNLSIALSEASNDKFYQEIESMFIETKKKAHELYNLMFKNGWYTLEEAKQTQIKQKYTEFSKRIKNELK